MEKKDIKQIFQEIDAHPERIKEILRDNKEFLSDWNSSFTHVDNEQLLQYLSRLQENQLSNNTLIFNPKVNFKQEMEFEILKESFKNGNHMGIFNNLSKSEQEKIINVLKENSVHEEVLSRIQEHFDNENSSKSNFKSKIK